MWVTIIADASFCPNTFKAGYGFWIASQRGKFGGDGVMKVDPVNNISAEMMALLNGLHVAVKRGLIRTKDSVLLQTDCQPAIDAFKRNRKNISKQEIELVQWFRSFTKEHKLHIKLKHVKGHSSNTATKYVVNNICDQNARRNMRQARNLHNQNQIMEYLK